jgi:cell wall-associated NlpC family hydrolase
MYGICDISCAPLRLEPSGKSEMTSMLLFGEHFSILSREDDWLYIRCAYEGYKGWLNEKQCRHMDTAAYEAMTKAPDCFSRALFQQAKSGQRTVIVPAGSTLPWYQHHSFKIGSEVFETQPGFESCNGSEEKQLIADAMKFLEAPYLWGGRSPFGIDCSGLTQVVFKINGIQLKRDAAQQATQGESVTFLGESRPGDLAFFDNREGTITHVGILMEDDRIIHASGKVRIDSIDQQGIFNRETGKHTHSLRTIKRIL